MSSEELFATFLKEKTFPCKLSHQACNRGWPGWTPGQFVVCEIFEFQIDRIASSECPNDAIARRAIDQKAQPFARGPIVFHNCPTNWLARIEVGIFRDHRQFGPLVTLRLISCVSWEVYRRFLQCGALSPLLSVAAAIDQSADESAHSKRVGARDASPLRGGQQ